MQTYDSINDITGAVIGCAFGMRNTYGRLMLESFYEHVMAIELGLKGLKVERQVPLDITHRGVVIPRAYYIDSVVNGKVALEYKALPYMGGEEFRQLMTYMKISGLKVGLLINFGAKDFSIGKFEIRSHTLTKGIYRLVNGYESQPLVKTHP